MWCEANVQVKMYKAHHGRNFFLEVEMLDRCTALWREAPFEVKHVTTCSRQFWTLKRCCVWHVQRILHFPKCEQNARVRVAISRTVAGVGHLKGIWRKDACRVAWEVPETCSPEMLGGKGADFLRGAAFWRIKSSSLLR